MPTQPNPCSYKHESFQSLTNYQWLCEFLFIIQYVALKWGSLSILRGNVIIVTIMTCFAHILAVP